MPRPGVLQGRVEIVAPGDAFHVRLLSMGEGTGSVLPGGGFRPLLVFHVAAGARLALRAAVPAVAALVVACGLSATPAAAMATMARLLAGPAAPFSAALVLALALSFASWAGPRATAGAAGWLTHLPCRSASRRRALAGALAAGQAPLVLLVASSALALATSPARVVGVLVAVTACAVAVLPVRSRARGLALAAAALGAWGSWGATALGAGMLVVADALAGPLQAPRARPPRALPLPLPLAIALRAAGRDLPGAWAMGALFLLACAAFLRHNVLPPPIAQSAIRGAGILSCTVITATLAHGLARRRPPWAWARSLPESTRVRVGRDAALLAGGCLPALLAALCLEGAGASGWGPVLLVLPWIALRGAAALRANRPDPAPLVAEGAFLAAWVALVPWLSLVPVTLLPWAVRVAVGAEKALSPHGWDERRHLPGANPLAWDESGGG